VNWGYFAFKVANKGPHDGFAHQFMQPDIYGQDVWFSSNTPQLFTSNRNKWDREFHSS